MSVYLDWARPRLNRLQDGVLHDTWARADLACLRASFGRPCGSIPRAARWSVVGMPGRGRAATPSRLERASWLAFALYAHHQQGDRSHPMQRDGERLSDAIVLLSGMREGTEVGNLLEGLGSIHGMREAAPWMLRLMRLLNGERIPCDHALLAFDLANLDVPERRASVLADWTRGMPRRP